MDDGLLIEQVSAFPQLFVKSDTTYRNKRLKENAWKTIGLIMEETAEACEHRWRILRNKYTALRREAKQTPSGSGATEISWPYFKSMNFLDPYLQTRKSFSNIRTQSVNLNEWDSLSQMIEVELVDDDAGKENDCSNNSVGVESEPSCSSGSSLLLHTDITKSPAVAAQPRQQKRQFVGAIPRHTLPPKKAKSEVLTDKMSGCFDTFQKMLETNISKQQQTNTQTPADDGDVHFVNSLVSDLGIFSKREKIFVKRQIYNVIADFLSTKENDD